MSGAVGGPPHAHLNEALRPLMDGSVQDRLDYLMQNQWLPHRKAMDAIARVETLLVPAAAPGAPSMFLCGQTGTGKSALLRHFCFTRPRPAQPDGMPTIPALYVRTPAGPDESRLWSTILLALGISHSYGAGAFTKAQQAKSALKRLKCGMLVLDELHNILHGPVTRRRQLGAALKTFGEELDLRIVVAGTKDAVTAWHTDDEMRRRWPRYDYQAFEDDAEFGRVLRSYRQLLPIARRSDLGSEAMRRKIHRMSCGVIGEVAEILRRAARRAIVDGSEEITEATLDGLEYKRLYDDPA